MFISKKTMRRKDYAALKAGHPNFKKFKVGKASLYRTNRGWFLSMIGGDRKIVVGEISVTKAQELLDLAHINYSTGW